VPQKDIVDLLKKRAMEFLEAAEERLKAESYDLACFFAEQAAQLHLKAVILELSGEVPRTPSIRQLLTIISKVLNVNFEFDRKSLIFLEYAYIKARYLPSKYEKDDAEEAIAIAKEVIEAVDRCRMEKIKNTD